MRTVTSLSALPVSCTEPFTNSSPSVTDKLAKKRSMVTAVGGEGETTDTWAVILVRVKTIIF